MDIKESAVKGLATSDAEFDEMFNTLYEQNPKLIAMFAAKVLKTGADIGRLTRNSEVRDAEHKGFIKGIFAGIGAAGVGAVLGIAVGHLYNLSKVN